MAERRIVHLAEAHAHDAPHDGRVVRMLTVLDEYTRECLAIVVVRRLKSDDVLHTLAELRVPARVLC